MRTLRPLLLVLCGATLAACGNSAKTVTVKGKTLTVLEAAYGTSGSPSSSAGLTPFCQPLAAGQFEVIITDFVMCEQTKQKPTPVDNRTLFHSTESASLRMIFPSALKKNSDGSFMTNTFQVGSQTTSFCRNQSGGTAAAFFAHNSAGQSSFDVNEEANGGSISVTSYTMGAAMQGTFDLTFGSDHVTGSFDALYCSGLTAAYGT